MYPSLPECEGFKVNDFGAIEVSSCFLTSVKTTSKLLAIPLILFSCYIYGSVWSSNDATGGTWEGKCIPQILMRPPFGTQIHEISMHCEHFQEMLFFY